MDKEMESRLPGAMRGRVMYIIPFSMGPIGGPLSKIGIQLTDFNYVILSMGIMTRVSPKVWDALGEGTEYYYGFCYIYMKRRDIFYLSG